MSDDNENGQDKPFLPDEELGVELDAWDSTFDALHGESESRAFRDEPINKGQADDAESMQLHERDRAVTATDEPGSDVLGIQDAASSTIEHPGSAGVRSTPGEGGRSKIDPGQHSRIGSGDALDSADGIDPGARDADRPGHGVAISPPQEPTLVPIPPASADDFADRPTPDEMPEYHEPEIVPRSGQSISATPLSAVPVAAKRTGPAIVRRAVPVPTASAAPRRATAAPTIPMPSSGEAKRDGRPTGDADGESDHEGGRRRAIDPTPRIPLGYAVLSREALKAPKQESKGIDDDDYADMEIGGSVSPEAAAAVATAPPPRRTVAHVVRRSAVPTQAPELKSETIRTTAPADVPASTLDEADFSDLAAHGPPGPRLTTAQPDESEDDFITEPARPRRRVEFADGVSTRDRDSAIDGTASTSVQSGDSEVDSTGDATKRSVSRSRAAAVDRNRSSRRSFARSGRAGGIDFGTLRFPEQVQPLSSSQFDEQIAQTLRLYEGEIAVADRLALRIEMGRLHEHLGDEARARSHYNAALLVDPRARPALRGLRRLACAAGDIAEALQHLDAEMVTAGDRERSAMREHRVELLLAAGAYEQARAAVAESLAELPRNARALLAAVELALANGGKEEVSSALERFADAVTDLGLRSALHSARGTIAGHDRDHASAIAWFATAVQADPSALVPRLAMAQHLAAQGSVEATAEIFVELARRLRPEDPVAATALAIRAQCWSASVSEEASALAAEAVPSDAVVTRVVAESAAVSRDPLAAATAMTAWAHSSASPIERAYAASRAAEFDPNRGAELWRIALDLDPDDDYAAAQLRTAFVASAELARAIDVDLHVAAAGARPRARLRAGFGLLGEGRLDEALAIFSSDHHTYPESIATAEALAEGYAAAGRWTERAQLLAELAQRADDTVDRDGSQLRSAVAWEEAVGAVVTTTPSDRSEIQRLTAMALDTWERILAQSDVGVPVAHAAAIVLATRLGDPLLIDQVLARAQAAERSRLAATSLALRRARSLMRDPARVKEAETIARGGSHAGRDVDDPRPTLWLVVGAARRGSLADAATALADRAKTTSTTPEAIALKLRAAQFALDGGDAARAVALLTDVQGAVPTLPALAELISLAQRKSGAPVPVSTARAVSVRSDGPNETFAHLIREADAAVDQGQHRLAIELFQRALELQPGDPVAMVPLVRVSRSIRDTNSQRAALSARLRAAEASGDLVAAADAYGQIAMIDSGLGNQGASVQASLESALKADSTRLDLLHRLQRELSIGDHSGRLSQLVRAELDQLPLDLAEDRAALLMDLAGLAERGRRAGLELAPLYRDVLAVNPRHRQALFLLESLVRGAGSSQELAQLEEQVAHYFDGNSRAQAAFFTRAGETLAEVDQIDAAIQKFGMADEALPGYVPALSGWRATAMKGQLWIDVAQAVTRLAATSSDATTSARYHHFAGVSLMDKALVGDQAMIAFRKALEADAQHKDAFVRLRILLEENASHDELAVVLQNRLRIEAEPAARLEIHRALAELHRNFLDARDEAKSHYRAILDAEPNDLRAHAAIADIAWEQGNWQEAADALIVRARLERDAATLSTLCYRLGLLYAERLSDPAMALRAFQRALTYQPDDINTLVRLVDLASVAGEWKLALGACERLVTLEQDPDRRVAHLHRVAKVLRLGFGDATRAERALNLALDGAPTNDDALEQLVQFYREAGDMTSVRVHLNRVIGVMRTRIHNTPSDGAAYRVIARAMAAREGAGVVGSLPVARVAAELAILLGTAAEPELRLVADPRRVELARLARPEADDVLFPPGVPPQLRQLFRALDDRVAKLVGFDLRTYGVGRGDRVRASESSVAQHAQEVATALGLGDIDVYISSRVPFAMVAEPASPWLLIIGQRIAELDSNAIRFAVGAALKVAQAGLAVPARLDADDLGNLVVALVRCFQPEFPSLGLDDDAIAMLLQKLRRVLSPGLLAELRPLALAIDGLGFSHQRLAADLHTAGLRSGLIASGSLTAGLQILAARRDVDVVSSLNDREAQQLIGFAIGEDHCSVTR